MTLDEIKQIVANRLSEWEFDIETFPADEIFNPGGAQAFLEKDGLYAHGEGRTPEQAVMLAAINALGSATKDPDDIFCIKCEGGPLDPFSTLTGLPARRGSGGWRCMFCNRWFCFRCGVNHFSDPKTWHLPKEKTE